MAVVCRAGGQAGAWAELDRRVWAEPQVPAWGAEDATGERSVRLFKGLWAAVRRMHGRLREEALAGMAVMESGERPGAGAGEPPSAPLPSGPRVPGGGRRVAHSGVFSVFGTLASLPTGHLPNATTNYVPRHRLGAWAKSRWLRTGGCSPGGNETAVLTCAA